MKKINAIIVDDEKHSVATLAWKLEKFCPDVQVIEKFTDSSEALDFLKINQPDLVFLDIEMPRLNGFEIIEELGTPLPFEVIFITAYDDFGIRAVKVDALDYLLKPIQNQELKAAIEKFKTKHPSLGEATSTIENNTKPKHGKIKLATKESIEFVLPEEIVCCSSESNYTMVYLASGRKKLISKTLKEVESWLKPHGFFRTHNSHLVNLAHIREYIRADGGYLLLSQDISLPVARNRKDDLLNLM